MKQTINVIAEIANAHQGDPKVAIELAKAAVDSGLTLLNFKSILRKNY